MLIKRFLCLKQAFGCCLIKIAFSSLLSVAVDEFIVNGSRLFNLYGGV